MVPVPVLLTGMETISMAKSGISVAIYLSFFMLMQMTNMQLNNYNENKDFSHLT